MAESGASRIIQSIRALGLQVAAHKTEAIIFGCDWPIERRNMHRLNIAGASVTIGTELKYLGIMLDSDWSFRSHFKYVAPRAERVLTALGRLMPNLRGASPDERVRRLYIEVIHSVLLYGAPIWAPAMSRVHPVGNPIRRLQRQMALRVIRAYRTVSYTAATALARILPIDLLATARKEVYDRAMTIRSEGSQLTERAMEALRQQARKRMIAE